MTTSRRGRGRAVDQRERQQAIRDFVGEAGHRTVDEIAEHTGVSSMTVYRDLAELEGLGLLRLSKGVVTAAASNLHEAASRYRLTQQVAEKQALARAALELIDPGSAIMLDDSTTGVFLARLLGERLPLTVVTNYLEVAREVQEDRDIRLLVTGGEYLVWADAFFGPMTVAAIKAMRAGKQSDDNLAFDQRRKQIDKLRLAEQFNQPNQVSGQPFVQSLDRDWSIGRSAGRRR